jgi:hypothetical protein
VPNLQQRILVVGNGNIDVGNKTPTRQPGQPIVHGPARRADSAGLRSDKPIPLKTERPKICGAMLQQCADSGSVSSPQKFVRLVGCRDSSVRREPWVRPRLAPGK